jgi:hypothetical protein
MRSLFQSEEWQVKLRFQACLKLHLCSLGLLLQRRDQALILARDLVDLHARPEPLRAFFGPRRQGTLNCPVLRAQARNTPGSTEGMGASTWKVASPEAPW